MRIALFNDTGRFPHVGCRAVSSGHDRMFARLGITVAHRSYYREAVSASALARVVESVDAVVVNGEGTIHHGGGRRLLSILAVAQSMGVATVLVNAVLQDVDAHRDTLARLTDCTVRDAESSAYLTRLGVRHRVVFDSILEADFADDVTERSGYVLVTDWHGARRDVGEVLARVCEVYGSEALFYPLESQPTAERWREALATFRSARLVVTARHHGVCLAAMAGVPFVACGSNTWKVEGLLSLMPGGLTLCDPDVSAVRAACREAESRPAVFTAIRQWVEAQRPLTTFQHVAEAVAA